MSTGGRGLVSETFLLDSIREARDGSRGSKRVTEMLDLMLDRVIHCYHGFAANTDMMGGGKGSAKRWRPRRTDFTGWGKFVLARRGFSWHRIHYDRFFYWSASERHNLINEGSKCNVDARLEGILYFRRVI